MPQLEVEKKAWIYNKEEIEAFLKSHGEYKKTLSKSDIYFCKKSDKAVDDYNHVIFRLRVEKEKTETRVEVTFKKKTIENNMEINVEENFSVDDETKFINFADFIGYRPFVKKIKRTDVYTYKTANVELSHVDELGDFLEVEIILQDKDSPKDSVKIIEEIFNEMKIPRENEEPRAYIKLLLAKQIGNGQYPPV